MKKSIAFILWCLLSIAGCVGEKTTELHHPRYAVAKTAAPVLNTPDWSFVFGGNDGKTLHLDSSVLIREVEFIALPGTVFTITDSIRNKNALMYRVTTNDYPYPSKTGLFVDSRFLKAVESRPDEPVRKLPPPKTIIENMLACKGAEYIWGGNYKEGVPQMLRWYPPAGTVSSEIQDKWMLKGVDCSGLLYEAANGCPPRNTSSLVNYGSAVEIAGLSVEQIIEKIEPLDLIVWKGHVIIVIDKETIIQSRPVYDDGAAGGVRIQSLATVLREVIRKRSPSDAQNPENAEETFVIRRWIHTN